MRYLTEEMIDKLILKCREEEAMMQDCDSPETDFEKTSNKDPYNALFVALTEVFSNMENLNRYEWCDELFFCQNSCKEMMSFLCTNYVVHPVFHHVILQI